MGEENEAANTQISQLSTPKVEEQDDHTLNFLDSLDNYIILIETLSSTLRQGWLELASARHSMGASRVNSVLLNLKPHSAATAVEVDYDKAGFMTKSPEFSLCKWGSPDNKDPFENGKFEEDEQCKENSSSQKLELHGSPQDSDNREQSSERNNGSETNVSPRESNGSETNIPRPKTEKLLQKERAKILSMFGTLVSPKLRASQLTFETALETLLELANARSSILASYDALHKDMKSTKE